MVPSSTGQAVNELTTHNNERYRAMPKRHDNRKKMKPGLFEIHDTGHHRVKDGNVAQM